MDLGKQFLFRYPEAKLGIYLKMHGSITLLYKEWKLMRIIGTFTLPSDIALVSYSTKSISSLPLQSNECY